MRRAAALAALLAALGLAACGGEDEETTSSAAPAESAPAATTDASPASSAAPATTGESEATVNVDDLAGSRMVAIYLDLNEKVHPVRRLVGSGRPELRPVLDHLLAGPTPDELAAGYTSAIPPGVQVLGLEGEGTDTVTVDLSAQFGTVGTTLSAQLALGQLVHTVVHELGPSVGVVLKLEGQPLTTLGEGVAADGRQTVVDVEDVTPPVLVQWPLPGDTAKCPQRVTGTSNTFEASSLLGFADSVDVIPEDPTIVTATSGTGTRGTFDVSVPCPDPAPSGTAYLVTWFGSAKDGSPQAVEHIPLAFP